MVINMSLPFLRTVLHVQLVDLFSIKFSIKKVKEKVHVNLGFSEHISHRHTLVLQF